MSRDHTPPLDLFEYIHTFVVAGADKELTEDHWTHFEQLLRESDDACELYFEYIEECCLLQTVCDAILREDSPSFGSHFSGQQEQHRHPHLLGILGSGWHGTLGYLSLLGLAGVLFDRDGDTWYWDCSHGHRSRVSADGSCQTLTVGYEATTNSCPKRGNRRPDHRDGRLQMERSKDGNHSQCSSIAWPKILAGFRSDGNYLRHWGQGYLTVAGDL